MDDIAVIGGGSAGEAAAIEAAHHGARVTLIERERVGGECPFFACMPSKALLEDAARIRGSDLELRWSLASIRRDAVVERWDGNEPSDGEHVGDLVHAGVSVRRGIGTIVGPGRVEVGENGIRELLRARSIIVATGSQPEIPPIEGLDRSGYWTSREALMVRELPSSLLILGGGVVGVELAQLFLRFGVAVTLVEADDALLSEEHPASSRCITLRLSAEGLALHTGVRATAIEPRGAGRLVHLNDGSVLEAAEVLIAVGRHPADMRSLGVERAGATVDDDGRIVLDDRLAATAGVFVAGDAAGGWQFTHVAEYEGRIAARAALGEPARADLRGVPRVIFTDPEAASVGMTVTEARDRGIDAMEITQDLATTSKGIVTGEGLGHLTAVVDRDERVLLGMFAVCRGAGELANEAALSIRLAIPIERIADSIHAFPTIGREMAEVYRRAAEQLR